MEKYSVKKNRVKDTKRAKTSSNAKKPPLKYGKELIAVGIMVLEALKQIFIRIYTSQNGLIPLPGFLGSVSLFLFWLVLEIHCQHRKNLWLKVLKEVTLLGSFCVYIINIQFLYFQDTEVQNISSGQYSLIFGTLLVFILLQNLLQVTIFSKLALVTGFFAYILAQDMKSPDTDFFSSGFNVLTPALYILGLIFIDFKNNPQQGKITNLAGPSDSFEINSSSPLLKMVDHPVFLGDQIGNFKLLNPICLPNIDYQNEIHFLNRISELKLIDEEILSADFKDFPQEVHFAQKDSTNYLPKKKTRQKVAIQIGVDPMANLASLLKSTLVRVCNKEIILPKLIKYSGEIENNDSITPLQIKLFILPNHKNPLIFTIQDDQVKEQLQSKKLCAQLQNSMINHFCAELYRIVELTKSTLQNLEDNLKLPITQNLSLLSRLIEDTIELFHENKYQPKFQYYRCDLKEILQNVASLFQSYAKSKNVKLTFQYQEADCTVSTDQERLIQLLIQLVYNAIKFTQGSSVHLSLQGYNNTFKIMVNDPGSLIPQGELGSIQSDLQAHKIHFGDVFIGKYKKKNLMLSHFTALGLGRKPLSGLHIKSSLESGTSIWFFVENRKISLLTSENLQKMKSSVSTKSNTGSSSHQSLRPSIFKMTHEYNNTQDSTSSLSEISESIQVGSVNPSPAFENIFPDNNYISPRPKSESFSASLKKYKKYKGTSSLLPSYIIEEVPDSPSRQGEYIFIVSKDISETDRILKLSAINGYIGVRIPSWENLGIEIKHKKNKIFMIIIDFEYIPNPEPLEQMIQKKTQECAISPLIVGITHSLSFGDIDHRPCATFVSKFISKPFDSRKFLSLIKSVYKSNNF